MLKGRELMAPAVGMGQGAMKRLFEVWRKHRQVSILFQSALQRMLMLAGAQAQVIEVITGSATIYRARLTGLAERNAHEACRQLRARQAACLAVRPGGLVEVSAEN